jgi:hypothetical protein
VIGVDGADFQPQLGLPGAMAAQRLDAEAGERDGPFPALRLRFLETQRHAIGSDSAAEQVQGLCDVLRAYREEDSINISRKICPSSAPASPQLSEPIWSQEMFDRYPGEFHGSIEGPMRSAWAVSTTSIRMAILYFAYPCAKGSIGIWRGK